MPHLKNVPNIPGIITILDHPIIEFQVGGAFALAIDNKGTLYSLGDNIYGQTGQFEKDIFFKFEMISPEIKFKKIAAGYQHSIFLTQDNTLLGCGKADKLQLGLYYPQYEKESSKLRESATGPIELNLRFDSPVIDIAAGKYHSLFLTGNIRYNI